MLFTLLLLNILKHDGVLTIKVISTDPSQSRPRDDGRVVISDSSIQHLEELTICLRFITYNFYFEKPSQVLAVFDFGILQSFAKLCYNPEEECKLVPWKVYGRTNFERFPGWSPGEWRSVCMSGSSVSRSWNITLDGRKTVSFEYDSYHKRSGENMVLMNKMEGFPRPLHGAVSDLQVWSRLLEEEELLQWLHCRSDLLGNFLTWESLHLNTTGGLLTSDRHKDDICWKENKKKKYFNFDLKMIFEETRTFCRNIGGEIATVESPENYAEMTEGLLGVCTHIYTGHRRSEEDGTSWLNVNTGARLAYNNWAPHEPLYKKRYSCALVPVNGALEGKFRTDECTYGNCPVCQAETPPVFMLRGVCRSVVMDRFFIMRASLELTGFFQTKLIYSTERKRWEIVNIHNKTVMAHTQPSVAFPLGKRAWQFDESNNCSDPGVEPGGLRTLFLHLEVPQPGVFCCDDGACIDSARVCDSSPDCQDRSDEADCSLLVTPPASYNRELPPAPSYQPLQLNLSFSVLKIFEISQEKSYFDLLYQLEVTWYDQNVRFQFLKTDPTANTLSEKSPRIWLPELKFDFVESEVLTGPEILYVQRKEAEPKVPGNLEDLNPAELYEGTLNPLNLNLSSRTKFSCSFDQIKDFPHDRQNCSVFLYLAGKDSERTTLVPGKLRNLAPTEFGQYIIQTWHFSPGFDAAAQRHGLRVSLVLTRKMRSVFMVTYLPTILMNIINQATNYIKAADKFSLIYTINITCMMVLASVYLSVSSSLPTTSDLKPVEMWLIFNLAYPMFVILVNVLLQVQLINQNSQLSFYHLLSRPCRNLPVLNKQEKIDKQTLETVISNNLSKTCFCF